MIFYAQTTPLKESGRTVLLENIPAGEVAFLIEMVEDARVDGGGFPGAVPRCHGHFPVKFGARFCKKAVTPSA